MQPASMIHKPQKSKLVLLIPFLNNDIPSALIQQNQLPSKSKSCHAYISIEQLVHKNF